MTFRIVDEYGKSVLGPGRDSEIKASSYIEAVSVRDRIRNLSRHNFFIETIRD